MTSIRKLSLAAAVLLVSASVAHAQASRTWVSGVGDDANPCSRTAPCKTFAGAISKTAAGGEISVLDPGGFGAVTITKSISIVTDGAIASILVSGTNAIVVNAGPNDVVVLRGLAFEGSSFGGGTPGLAAVRFLNGKALHIEDCAINGFGGTSYSSIDFEPQANGSQLFVKDVIVHNNPGGNGILIAPPAGVQTTASIDGATLSGNYAGLVVQGSSVVSVRDTAISGNLYSGLHALAGVSAPQVTVSSSSVANNGGAGIRSEGSGALVYIDRTTISGNLLGLRPMSSGQIVSFGNNDVAGNSILDGSPSSVVASK